MTTHDLTHSNRPFHRASIAALISCATLYGSAVFGAEDYSRWAFAGDFVTDSAQVRDLSHETSALPVLVRLDAANFDFAQAAGDGSDIRFSDARGEALPYEIEHWDPVEKSAEIWVNLPAISVTSCSKFRMHWGNASAASESDGAAVFARKDGFAGVWHFRPNSFANTSSGGNDAAFFGGETAPSPIFSGIDFDGETSELWVQDKSLDFSPRELTVSAWFNANYLKDGNRRILQKGIDQGLYSLGFESEGETLRWSVSGACSVDAKAPEAGSWHQAAATYDGSECRLYLDGELKASKPANGQGRLDGASEPLGIGFGPGRGSADHFEGQIDEVRIARQVRSADWIKLDFLSQRRNSTLLSLVPVPCAARFDAPNSLVVEEGRSVELVGTTECASQTEWSILSGPCPASLDPESRVLAFVAPSVKRDREMVCRFSALYEDGWKTKDVRILIRKKN